MNGELKILIVEHDLDDINLVHRALDRAGIKYVSEVVHTEEGFTNALRNFFPDIILSDYSLPTFNGSTAFDLKQKIAPFIPFIIVSGVLGEENAVELIKSGITDYVLKDRLVSLTVKISRALKDAEDNRKRILAEQVLKQNESKLNEAQAIANVGSWEIDMVSGVETWSNQLFNIFAIEKTPPSTDLLISFIHPDDAPVTISKMKKAFETGTGSSVNFRFIRKDGEERYGYSRWKFDRDNNDKPVRLYGIVQDVTNKTVVVQELQEAHNKLLFHMENAPLGFIEWDEQLRVKSWSKQAEQIFGWTEEEFQSKQNSGYSQVYSEDTAQAANMMHQLVSGEVDRNSAQFRSHTKEGGIIWCEWFNSVLRDKNGKVDTVMSLVQDITERKMAEDEIRSLNENLENRVKERTAELTDANIALEAFSYSVSHDLRSPVRTLMGFAKIINRNYGSEMNEDMKNLLGQIENSGKQMSGIIDSLLVLAKYGKEKLNMAEVDLNVMINDVWQNLRLSTNHQATLQLPRLPAVYADGAMLQQVLVNLCSNAVKYSSKKENPAIQVGYSETAEQVTIWIKDNGAGFDMAMYDRLFGAFQRLHGTGEFEGTGVGLMLIKRIIDRHGGKVWAEGKVDEGATFYFSLLRQDSFSKQFTGSDSGLNTKAETSTR